MNNRSSTPLVVLVVALAVGAGVVIVPGLLALVVPGAIALTLAVLLARRLSRHLEDPSLRRRVLNWTVAAFAVHLALALVITSVHSLVGYLGPDALGYHDMAGRIVEHWAGTGPPVTVSSGKEGFYYMLAGLYWVFGPHWTSGLAVNAALAAALVPLMTDATCRLFGERAGRAVPPLMVLVPGFLVWPSQLLREAGALFLLAATVAFTVRLLVRFRAGSIVGLVTVLALLLTFRGSIAPVVAGGVIVGLSLGRKQLLPGISTALATVMLILLLVVGLGVGYSGYRSTVSADLARADAVRTDSSRSANSGFGHSADISTPRGVVAYLPRAVPQLLFGPFPWQVRSARQVPAMAENAVWLALIPSLWRGVVAGRRRVGRGVLALLLPAGGLSLVLSLAVGNYGTLLRERTQLMLLLVPFLALGLTERRRRRRAAVVHPVRAAGGELVAA